MNITGAVQGAVFIATVTGVTVQKQKRTVTLKVAIDALFTVGTVYTDNADVLK